MYPSLLDNSVVCHAVSRSDAAWVSSGVRQPRAGGGRAALYKSSQHAIAAPAAELRATSSCPGSHQAPRRSGPRRQGREPAGHLPAGIVTLRQRSGELGASEARVRAVACWNWNATAKRNRWLLEACNRPAQSRGANDEDTPAARRRVDRLYRASNQPRRWSTRCDAHPLPTATSQPQQRRGRFRRSTRRPFAAGVPPQPRPARTDAPARPPAMQRPLPATPDSQLRASRPLPPTPSTLRLALAR